MNDGMLSDNYGSLIEPTTLKIQRMLPGPVERIWAYLTDSELRRKWLAAGVMKGQPGADFELVWRNEELNDPPSKRPEGFSEESRMKSRILEFDPPRKLAITWRDTGDVTFELEPRGERVLLTIVHRRFPDRGMMLKHMAGWHMHLDVLVARVNGLEPAPFWDGWAKLHREYETRLPA
ncbi:SRPBCC family protein [Bradyrhizobium lablabi]|uniref:SRPBCC family protein n=1 Tax=Bradyrhizobium lablabi TaxID=722472 RepID=UPI001BA97C29|nr:SRPBCC family protein [Bradyrhizobium lablabi]MBR1122326.1 SRPBCC family protein [Bradyrhizobium lablabi]